jgi:hypothetical protein
MTPDLQKKYKLQYERWQTPILEKEVGVARVLSNEGRDSWF